MVAQDRKRHSSVTQVLKTWHRQASYHLGRMYWTIPGAIGQGRQRTPCVFRGPQSSVSRQLSSQGSLKPALLWRGSRDEKPNVKRSGCLQKGQMFMSQTCKELKRSISSSTWSQKIKCTWQVIVVNLQNTSPTHSKHPRSLHLAKHCYRTNHDLLSCKWILTLVGPIAFYRSKERLWVT